MDNWDNLRIGLEKKNLRGYIIESPAFKELFYPALIKSEDDRFKYFHMSIFIVDIVKLNDNSITSGITVISTSLKFGMNSSRNTTLVKKYLDKFYSLYYMISTLTHLHLA